MKSRLSSYIALSASALGLMSTKVLRNKLKVKKYKTLNETLRAIFLEIKDQKIKKNIIFFSPAGASFDSFKNFEDRGNYFNKIVKKLIYAK